MNLFKKSFLGILILIALGIIVPTHKVDAGDCSCYLSSSSCTSTRTTSTGCVYFSFETQGCVSHSGSFCGPACTPSCGSWDSCSVSCGGGTQSHTCTRADCSTYIEWQSCNTQACLPTAITVTVTADPMTVPYGGGSTINWISTEATSCSESGGRGGTDTIGTFSVPELYTTTTFPVTCTAPGYCSGTVVGSCGYIDGVYSCGGPYVGMDVPISNSISLKMFIKLGGKSTPSLTEKHNPCACPGP